MDAISAPAPVKPSAPADAFNTDHLKEDLKGRSVRGGAVTFIGQGVKFCLQMFSTMALARMLTPHDFGLFAMVAALTSFMMIFKDLGLSQATVQKAEINHGQVSTLFWINMALGVGLALLTAALAPAVAWFYKEPKLVWVTVALAGGFVFGALTVQHQALLRREMRFMALVVIDIVAMAIGIATGVGCAWSGLGYWALVFMQLATALATAVGVWLAGNWRPGLPVLRSGVRSMLAFGGNLTGFGFVNYFARNLDNILLGRYAGAGALGFYSRAYSLLLMPIGQITAPITAVAVPTLSRLQNDPERFRNYYLKAIKFIAYVSMPMVVAMGVLSNEIVAVVLGPQWKAAGPVFMALSVAALFQPVGSTVGWVYVALGQTRRMFLWVCMAFPFIALSFILGLRWGALGVAIAYSICVCIMIYPEFAFALRYSSIRVSDVFDVCRFPFVLSICVGIFVGGARGRFFCDSFAGAIIFPFVVGVVGASILVWIFAPMREDVRDLLSLMKIEMAASDE